MESLRRGGIGDAVWTRWHAAVDGGVPADDLVARVSSVFSEAGDRLAVTLQRRAPQMLREHGAERRAMQRRMRAIWGPAFDALYEVYVCVEEIGSDLQQLHGPDGDRLVEALLGLHARTCLVLAEVHALMVQGFPLGAWARTRSLHEAAVLAALLSSYGREPGTDDLAERFLLHAIVDEARDVELALRNGVDIADEELMSVRGHRADVVERYGTMFTKDYGWARPLFPSLGPKERVTFDRLEAMADVGLDRLHYRLGGHHVHSSAWTVALSELPRGGRLYRLTGPTNVGFGDPALVALSASVASTSAVVHGCALLPEPMHLVGLAALRTLRVRAIRLFAEGQALVDGREERLQARRKLTHRRRSPVD